jgi:hypothetical protein
MRGISRSFPGVRALDGVDFTVRAGEIHALMEYQGFFSARVLVNFFSDNAFVGISAVGMTFVILSGGSIYRSDRCWR